MTITDKVAFKTCEGKSIGLDTAHELGRRGIQIILKVRNAEQGNAILKYLKRAVSKPNFSRSTTGDYQKKTAHP